MPQTKINRKTYFTITQFTINKIIRYVWNNYSSITGVSSSVGSGTFFEINRTIKVLNGNIQYFVKGQIVKPNEYYKFRSEMVNK